MNKRTLAAGAIALAAACSNSGAPPGDGAVNQSTSRASGGDQFTSPTDAAPSPDGKVIYFVATAPDGSPGVFSVPASGSGGATALYSGAALGAPFGIAVSGDGKTLYVADPAAPNGKNDLGGIFSLPASGGTPAVVAGTEDSSPQGLTMGKSGGSEEIWYTGYDANFAPGVFRVGAAGGAPSAVASGDAFQQPSGLAVDAQGNAYVVDSAGYGDAGHVLLIKKGAVSELAAGFDVGFPAGIALAQDEQSLLVAARDQATGKDAIARVLSKTGALDLRSAGVDAWNDAGGLHRAASADLYAFTDLSAAGSGAVFLVSK